MQYQTAIPAAPHHPSLPVHPPRPRASRSRFSIYQSLPFRCPQVGFNAFDISSFENTWSAGSRLTLCAPLLIACSCTVEMPLRLLLMLPASLIVSLSLKTLRGGAKSSDVNVPDLRSMCLCVCQRGTNSECAGSGLTGWEWEPAHRMRLRADDEPAHSFGMPSSLPLDSASVPVHAPYRW